jgi:hypothetical protein
MKRSWRKYNLLLGLVIAMTIWMGEFGMWRSMAVAPTIVLTAILITWLTKRPILWLILIIMYWEIRSILPLGIVPLVVMWPWLWRLWMKVPEPDASFRFVIAIIFSTWAQMTTLLLGEWWLVRVGLEDIWKWWIDLPWLMLTINWMITGGLGIGLTWLLYTLWRPSEQNGVSSVDQQRVKYI